MDLKKIKGYYDSLRRASELFDLDERASLQDVKQAYRKLARRWHPDRAGGGHRSEAEERMKTLNEAYALLKAYCEGYPIPFTEESLQESDPFYDHFRRFYHDYFSDDEPSEDEKY